MFILTEEEMPKTGINIICTIHKKDDKLDCNQQRNFLISVAYLILLTIHFFSNDCWNIRNKSLTITNSDCRNKNQSQSNCSHSARYWKMEENTKSRHTICFRLPEYLLWIKVNCIRLSNSLPFLENSFGYVNLQ